MKWKGISKRSKIIKKENDPETWEKVKSLLDAVMDLEDAEQLALLDKECAGDDLLKQEVLSYLVCEETMGDFLVAPVFSWQGTSALASGTLLDSYRILREIGHGGMGVVYLAERSDDTFNKQVAVKVLKRGMDTDEILRRFHRERQIVAQFEHTNIARLLDAGATADGLPYFVLEYVQGIPIDRYCDARRLSVRERLELFRTVCSAVHLAHQNLVVHRDLKPTNVLVTADGTPKLLDFGIAKILRQDAEPTRTARDQQLLTPDYASPEQVLGQAITTASDVYSLGVLLFQLLTHKKPYHIDTLDRAEMARIIGEFEPLRPSVVVAHGDGSQTGEEAVAPGCFGKDSPPWTRSRLLSGDLDNIVLMALRKEPQRRYSSVAELSEDIRRYLEELPIIARRDTFSYRTSKFIRRHRAFVASATLALLLILGFTAALAVQLRQTALERDRAENLLEFSIELANSLDPTYADPDPPTKEEILTHIGELVRSGFGGNLEDRADLLDRIGRLYRVSGLFGEARSMLEEALRIRRDELDDDEKVAASLHNLSFLLREMGDDAAAEPLLREALSIQKHLYQGQESAELARGLNNLATFLASRGKYEEAAALYQEVLEVKRRLHGGQHEDVMLALNNLATALIRLHQEDLAEPYLREALELNRKLLPPDHPRIAENLNNLAKILENRQEYEVAEALYREALELKRKSRGGDHLSVGYGLNNLAFCIQAAGRLKESEDLYRQALGILDRHPDQNPGARSVIQRNLASDLATQGKGEACEKLANEALATMIRTEEVPWRIADVRSVLGQCLMLQGRLEEAKPLLSEGLQEIRSGAGDDSLQYRDACARISKLHQDIDPCSLSPGDDGRGPKGR